VTPLLWADGNSHTEIVARFLARIEVTWNAIDEDGETSLSWAIQNGYGGVVQHLFARAELEAEADWEHFLEEELTTVVRL
jgi:ankyrin repeat protein